MSGTRPRVPVQTPQRIDARVIDEVLNDVKNVAIVSNTQGKPQRGIISWVAKVASGTRTYRSVTLRKIEMRSGRIPSPPKIRVVKIVGRQVRKYIGQATVNRIRYAAHFAKASIRKSKEDLDVLRAKVIANNHAVAGITKLISLTAWCFPARRGKKKRTWTDPKKKKADRVILPDLTAHEAVRVVMDAVGVKVVNPKAVDMDGYGVYKYTSKAGSQISVNLGVKTIPGPLPPEIKERRADERIKAVATKNTELAQRMDELFTAFKLKARSFVGKILDSMRKRIKDRGRYLTEKPSPGNTISVPCGPGSRLIGYGGISDIEIARITAQNISEDDRTAEIADALTRQWPEDLSGLHHAYRNPIVHLCGGGGNGNAFITDEGIIESAIFAMAMRGMNVKEHVFFIFRHSDKPGRSDFHVLIARAGTGGIWGLDSAMDGAIGALHQNVATAFAGLSDEFQVNMPWGMSARKLVGSAALLNNKGRDGNVVAARYFDCDTGTTRNVPILGEQAVRRWVEAMRGKALSPADAMIIWTMAKNRRGTDRTEIDRSLIGYVLRQGKHAKAVAA